MSLFGSVYFSGLQGRPHRVHVVNIDANTNTLAPIGIHVIHELDPQGEKAWTLSECLLTQRSTSLTAWVKTTLGMTTPP